MCAANCRYRERCRPTERHVEQGYEKAPQSVGGSAGLRIILDHPRSDVRALDVPTPNWGLSYTVLRWVFRNILRLGFGLTVTGQQHVPASGPVILAPNHRSDIDPVVMAAAIPRRCRFLAAAELLTRPVLGAVIRHFRAVPITRGRFDRAAIEGCLRCLERGAGRLPGGTHRRRRAPSTRPRRGRLPRDAGPSADYPGRNLRNARGVAVRNQSPSAREDHCPHRPGHRPVKGEDPARPISVDRMRDRSDHAAVRQRCGK